MTLWVASLTRLDTGWAPIKWWQVLEALAAQIWVLTRCLFISEWNAGLFSRGSTSVYLWLTSGQPLFTNSWSHVPNSFHCDRFFAPEKLRESFYIWRVLICRGHSLQKQVKRVTFAPNRKFLPISQPFFSTEWNSQLVRFFLAIFETECKILQPYCHFPRYPIVHPSKCRFVFSSLSSGFWFKGFTFLLAPSGFWLIIDWAGIRRISSEELEKASILMLLLFLLCLFKHTSSA